MYILITMIKIGRLKSISMPFLNSEYDEYCHDFMILSKALPVIEKLYSIIRYGHET